MSPAQTEVPAPPKPLRVWPGVVIVALLWLVRFGIKIVVPGFQGFKWGIMGEFFFVLAFLVWWVFFSRARWSERLGAIVLMIAALFATLRLNHESMGPLWLLAYALPVLCLAFVIWAVASRRLADGPRRATMAATILLACGAWMAVRTDGITGDHEAEFQWRWTKTREERLLAQVGGQPPAVPAAPVAAEVPGAPPVTHPAEDLPMARGPAVAAAETSANWPGFRGPGRDGVISGVRIKTDWSASPPVALWRRAIGPGWSSFAVRGDLLYTQEQRGDEEIVACYNANTGEPVWTHRDAARFFESNAGAGPRATPTISNGRVYTFGATGILNALGASDGAVVWSRKVAADTGRKVPDWGFASSPLVVDDVVIVAAEGQLVGYDLAGGARRWTGPSHVMGYSSPHLLTIDGVAQVLLMSGFGATSVAPGNGTPLWEHRWRGFAMVQPARASDNDVLLGGGETLGMRRIAVARGPGGWTVEERWTSTGLKPYFNDFVVHDGHVFGFDGRILACLDLKDGKRKWKGGRYGNGQLVLLADQGVLLVLSEEGELALVRAASDQFTELARFPAMEGKTWNHPVLIGDRLFVRNANEMVAFRLPVGGN